MVGCFRQKETRAEFLSLVRQPGAVALEGASAIGGRTITDAERES